MHGSIFVCLILLMVELSVGGKYTVSDVQVGKDPSHSIRIVPHVKNEGDAILIRGTIYVLKPLSNENTVI